MDILIPFLLNSLTFLIIFTASPKDTLSVISISMSFGSILFSINISVTIFENSIFSNCFTDIFTDMGIKVLYLCFHMLICLQTSFRTHSPIEIICPVFSAIGINLSGGTTPSIGLFHLNKASAPTMFFSFISNIG